MNWRRAISPRWRKPPTASKGAFAMLNLVPGKQLCETLEHLIREKDAQGIEKYISDIDVYVKSLL
ncbi:two-component sensor protein RcsD [Klebsiella michiganensis]|uniref:Two-component sensor protein RcsD n=1 Tax=Klebsiella michiganensis TaxID=1134687 RepID=A0A7H4PPH7_9ENTR|nr:two-component sensor protein RcsD [Klebsiella michiganensis]